MNFPCLKKWWGFDLVWFWFAFVLGGFLQRIEEGVDSWYMPEAIKLKPLYNETLSRSILIFFLFHTVFKTPKSCLAEEFKLCLEVCCRENGCPATTHFSLKLFQWVFISNCIMIQGPRVGTIIYWGPPFLSGRRSKSRGEVGGARSDLPRKCAFCYAVIPGWDPWDGAEGLVHSPVPLAHGDVTALCRHCLLTAVEVQVVLPAVLSLVLVWEAAVKGGGFVVLDFSLDVFGHPDS